MTQKSPITTHILDIGSGQPAAGVSVTLEKIVDGQATVIARSDTDNDGRLVDWLEKPVTEGHYRLRFATGHWYEKKGLATFYPEIVLDFQVTDEDEHYHVPLLLNQWGYSTYRGS